MMPVKPKFLLLLFEGGIWYVVAIRRKISTVRIRTISLLPIVTYQAIILKMCMIE